MHARSLTVVVDMLLGEQRVLKAQYGLLARRLNRLAETVGKGGDAHEQQHQEIKARGVELASAADEWATQTRGMRDSCLAVARANDPTALKHMALIHDAERAVACSSTLLGNAFCDYANACESVAARRGRRLG